MGEYEAALKAYQETPSFSNELFSPYQLWYQYRGFKSFWTILKSDSFWATDARFCNDSEEQRFGTSIVRGLLSKQSSDLDRGFNEDFILCFCAEDDKLSQWRGYAPDGGVSVGFDFNTAVPFYIPLAQEELNYQMPISTYRKAVVYAGRVCYLPPSKEKQTEDEYIQECADRLMYPASQGYTELGNNVQGLKRCIPFIKHVGFREEDECRLVFHNKDGKLSPCVRYREMDADGIRKPYIIVRPGDSEFNNANCVVRLCLKTDFPFTKELLKRLKGALRNIKIDNCRSAGLKSNKTDKFCFGCTRRCQINNNSVIDKCRYKMPGNAEFQWGLQKDEHSITISQGRDQEKVFHKVYPIIKELDSSISIWCDGHLPIRSITIGPCTHQEEVLESVSHYCKHTYWLQDVVIKGSTIPFRRVK